MYKIEHFEVENEFNVPQSKTDEHGKIGVVDDKTIGQFVENEIMRGSEIMEQVDDEILSQFLSELEKTFSIKIIKAECSQTYPSFIYFCAIKELRLEIADLNNSKVSYKLVLDLSATDCEIRTYNADASCYAKKIWRNVLLKHFREQVAPYLKAEKVRKQKSIENELKELDKEFTFDDGIKI